MNKKLRAGLFNGLHEALWVERQMSSSNPECMRHGIAECGRTRTGGNFATAEAWVLSGIDQMNV
jgi:hypothetical protein